jgi:hypothetical protein
MLLLLCVFFSFWFSKHSFTWYFDNAPSIFASERKR